VPVLTILGKNSHLLALYELRMVFLDLGPVASMKEPANKTIYLNQSLLQNDQDCKKKLWLQKVNQADPTIICKKHNIPPYDGSLE
jgi:hypothetical protein